MDEAAAVRGAAREAVGDVSPAAFRDDIDAFVAAGSTVPGVVTLLAAEAVGADAETHTERAVGVQLIYDGLRLTRQLADAPPWTGDDAAARDQADIDILAADVLVARGFYLLADTDAATRAVDVVQSFGRTQTDRQAQTNPPVDRDLEADVLELALIAGVAAAGETPRDPGALAGEFIGSEHGYVDIETLFDTAARERIAAAAGGGGRPLNRND